MRLPLAGRGRAMAVLLGWIAAAVVAGVIGVTAIDAVGQGIVGSSTTPLSAEQVDGRLAEQSASATATSSAVPPASTPITSSAPPTTPPAATEPGGTSTEPQPGGEAKLLSTRGGDIVARCEGANAIIVSTSPAQGYQVDRDDDQDDGARVDFESDDDRVRVEIFCVDGEPEFTLDD